jgi:O-antigen ligase
MAVGRKVLNTKQSYLWWLLAIGALVALWTSHSRSAWIAAIVATLLLCVARYRTMLTRKLAAWLLLAVVVLAAGVYGVKDTSFFHNVVLHDNPTTGASIDSNTGHVDSIVEGTAKLLVSPLGSGVGSTGSASLYGDAPVIIENQYLFTAHEVGWLGLVLFVAIFTTIMVRLWRQRQDWKAAALFASGVGLATIGILLPVWVDDTVSIIWWGLAAVQLSRSAPFTRLIMPRTHSSQMRKLEGK